MTFAKLNSNLVARSPLNSVSDAANRSANLRKRRGLVLTDEQARHPFRATLPPNVRADLHDIPAESLWRLTAQDVRGVASTYIATTAAILAFIS